MISSTFRLHHYISKLSFKFKFVIKFKFPGVIKLEDAVKWSVLELHASVPSSEYFMFPPLTNT
jgi:hypothetical protein